MGKNIYSKYIKRLLDIALSIMMIILGFPIFIIIFILSRIILGSPTIFKQVRVGYKGEKFCLYKFRTMHNRYSEDGELLPDIERASRFGSMLRKLSLDEIMQFFNILKGDMSFIGPRPLLVEYIPYYTEEEFRRHDVRPGITGVAQINGRNFLGWEERFRHDVYYVDNCSFALDLSIVIKTIMKVIKRQDIMEVAEGGVDEISSYTIVDGIVYRPMDKERASRAQTDSSI